MVFLSRKVQLRFRFLTLLTRSYNPPIQVSRFRLFPFRSPLLRESLLISLPPVTEMFHFTGLSSTTYVFSYGLSRLRETGFPHSEIAGSKVVCTSPTLIAAYHVLHRLHLPRHPLYALVNLTILFNLFKLSFDLKYIKTLYYFTLLLYTLNFQGPPIDNRRFIERTVFFTLCIKNPNIYNFIKLNFLNSFNLENAGFEPATFWLQTRRSPS